MFRSVLGHFFKASRVTLDNLVFRLHYRVSVGLLLTCVVVILWKINFGHPINCVSRDGFDGNDHCWYHGTYTKKGIEDKVVGIDIPAPGVDYRPSDEVVWHNTHRWVTLCFLVQALFFYLPRLLWRVLEGRRVHRLIWNMNSCRNPEDVALRKRYVLDYLSSNSNIIYAFGHLFCEVLNLVNVVVQLSLVKYILQVPFVSLGMLVKPRILRTDASALSAFPSPTMCTAYRYGASGDVQKHNFMCFMTVNNVMEMLFTCLGIWFTVLTVLSFLAILYRVVTLFIPPLRVWRLEAKTKLTGHMDVVNLTRRLGFGQWFLLYQLSKNLDPVHMRDILESLASGKPMCQPSGDVL